MGSLPTPYPPPIDKSIVPKCSITKISADAPIDDILDIIARDGGVILTDLLSEEQLASVKQELEPHSNKTGCDIAIIPKETDLISGLVGKSKTIASVCEKPVLEQLRNNILADSYPVIREDVIETHTIDPQLSISLALNIGYNAPRQRLHRDDSIHRIKHDQKFELKNSSQFGCLIAGCETTRENGATMFIPGSHLWDDKRQPKPEEVCYAEMQPGSALIFLASSYHGGGHNSVKDSFRVVYGLFFIRGTLRQEENQFLAVPRSVVLGMSPKMQSLLGYKKPRATLGVVEAQDPMTNLPVFLEQACA